MRIILSIILLFLLNGISFSQIQDQMSPFSKFSINILGGVNFHDPSEIGGSLRVEGKSNLNTKLKIKLSAGYSLLSEQKEQYIKSYRHVVIEKTEGYEIATYLFDKADYYILPVNLGLEYQITSIGKFSPYGTVEFGYNFYTKEQQVAGTSGWQILNTKEEIPSEYRNPLKKVINDSCYGFSVGAGFNYKISSSLSVNLQYTYRYNDSLINLNEILLGLLF